VSWRTWAGVLLVVNGYVLIYYRLMVRHYYQEARGIREGTFGTLFSFPPTRGIPEAGRKYVRRYWVSLFLMVSILLFLALISDGSTWIRTVTADGN